MTTPQETEDIKGMRTYLVCENPPHYLTPANDSDVSEIVRVLSINKDVYYGTATFQFPFLESHALKRLEMVNRYRESLKFNSHFAVHGTKVHPDTSRSLKIAELGYWISPEHTGKGFASRSVQFILNELVFKEFGCDICKAEIFSENEASRKTLLKAGLECEFEGKVLFIPKFNQNKVLSCFAKHRDDSTLSVRWQA
ncbi:hypothetical protein BG005_008292 [Podila minutissima]|nr:hypothetical protein BG005_008292 [Podila minutissima]